MQLFFFNFEDWISVIFVATIASIVFLCLQFLQIKNTRKYLIYRKNSTIWWYISLCTMRFISPCFNFEMRRNGGHVQVYVCLSQWREWYTSGVPLVRCLYRHPPAVSRDILVFFGPQISDVGIKSGTGNSSVYMFRLNSILSIFRDFFCLSYILHFV